MNHLLITFEILFTVVAPLLVLYLRGAWKQQTMVSCMSTIPILWYFVYAPIHELSHLLGAYLVGGQIVEVKLILLRMTHSILTRLQTASGCTA